LQDKGYSKLRIIGGKWRSRQLPFPTVAGLRPTPNRVRETLFNWLAPYIVDANCLDLFAGSGALGIEALSRGASSTTFIDQSFQITSHLKQQLTILDAKNVYVHQATFPFPATQLHHQCFNIVFCDPPFHQGFIKHCCEWLEEAHLLAPNALIYIEAETALHPLPIPQHWQILRNKIAGQIGYYLIQRT
jgi:16S rRNA (guanine966-N2)-methyltransferase